MSDYLKGQLPDLTYKRFNIELLHHNYADAAALAFHFKWLFPDHSHLTDIIASIKEQCETLIAEKKYSVAGQYFELLTDLESGNEVLDFVVRLVQSYDISLGGFCPWCGSNRLWGRKGWLWRYCKQCGIKFNMLCPICKSIHLSWTWNPEKGEYGCDRCQNVATPDEIQQNKFRPSPFSLKREKKRD